MHAELTIRTRRGVEQPIRQTPVEFAIALGPFRHVELVLGYEVAVCLHAKDAGHMGEFELNSPAGLRLEDEDGLLAADFEGRKDSRVAGLERVALAAPLPHGGLVVPAHDVAHAAQVAGARVDGQPLAGAVLGGQQPEAHVGRRAVALQRGHLRRRARVRVHPVVVAPHQLTRSHLNTHSLR